MTHRLVGAALAALCFAATTIGPVIAAEEAAGGGAGTGTAAVVPQGERQEPAPPAPEESNGDPWEGMNRKIFWFNDQVDVYVLEPTARGWDFVLPQPVQRGIGNFFSNLRFPIIFVNDAFQAKPLQAMKELGRFFVNTTVGAAGFLDPASEIGLGEQEEDFGQTLGVWGVPSGNYLVLPFLGPSNMRDAGGLGFDAVASITVFYLDWFVTAGARVVDIVNTRARFLRDVADAKAASLDYYAFVRNAYEQRRKALIEDRTGTGNNEEGAPDETLYDVQH